MCSALRAVPGSPVPEIIMHLHIELPLLLPHWGTFCGEPRPEKDRLDGSLNYIYVKESGQTDPNTSSCSPLFGEKYIGIAKELKTFSCL